jgi:hypothetical protein
VEVDNIPFFTKNLSLGDKISVVFNHAGTRSLKDRKCRLEAGKGRGNSQRAKTAGPAGHHVALSNRRCDYSTGERATTMSMSGKALKLIQRSFSELRLCKDMLVIPPTEHIIRGFVFERTPYKGLFYFWRVVLPLYTQWSVITLRYSKRLAKADYIDLGELEFERSIHRLIQVISHGELDDLRSLRQPQDFLDRFGGASSKEGYAPMISPFDAALTYYLVGSTAFCLDILDDFASEDLYLGSVDIHLSARDLVREMRIDSLAGERKIRASERASIERFALGPTISDHKAV